MRLTSASPPSISGSALANDLRLLFASIALSINVVVSVVVVWLVLSLLLCSVLLCYCLLVVLAAATSFEPRHRFQAPSRSWQFLALAGVHHERTGRKQAGGLSNKLHLLKNSSNFSIYPNGKSMMRLCESWVIALSCLSPSLWHICFLGVLIHWDFLC